MSGGHFYAHYSTNGYLLKEDQIFSMILMETNASPPYRMGFPLLCIVSQHNQLLHMCQGTPYLYPQT